MVVTIPAALMLRMTWLPRRKLLELVKQRGKDYGIIVRQVQGTDAHRRVPESARREASVFRQGEERE
jgi:hypothetical protein